MAMGQWGYVTVVMKTCVFVVVSYHTMHVGKVIMCFAFRFEC